MPGKSRRIRKWTQFYGFTIFYSSSSSKTFKVRECPLRIAGVVTHLHGEPHPVIPGRTLDLWRGDSEISCILVAGIKRAFSLTTDLIPRILPRQNIPEDKCNLGHSLWGTVRLGGHIFIRMAFFNILKHRFLCTPIKRTTDLGEVIISSCLKATCLVENELNWILILANYFNLLEPRFFICEMGVLD